MMKKKEEKGGEGEGERRKERRERREEKGERRKEKGERRKERRERREEEEGRGEGGGKRRRRMRKRRGGGGGIVSPLGNQVEIAEFSFVSRALSTLSRLVPTPSHNSFLLLPNS